MRKVFLLVAASALVLSAASVFACGPCDITLTSSEGNVPVNINANLVESYAPSASTKVGAATAGTTVVMNSGAKFTVLESPDQIMSEIDKVCPTIPYTAK
jgi:hypothetical protein